MNLTRQKKRSQVRKNEKTKHALTRKFKSLDLSNFEYVADDPNLTFSAIGSELVDFLTVLDLSGSFDRRINIDKRDSLYSSQDLSLLLVLLNLLGCDRIENSRVFNSDQVLLEKLNLDRIPDPETLRDELERYDLDNLNELFLVNQDLLAILKQLTGPKEVDLHIDAKVITLFGNQEDAEVGYNPRYRGRNSYHLKVCTIEPFGFVLAINLQPGSATSATEFVDFYKKCVAAVPQDHFVIRTIRLDSGFFSEGSIESFEADYVFFEVVAKKNPDLKTFISEMIPDEDFEPFNPAETMSGAAFSYRLKSWSKPRDFVVVRKLLKANANSQIELFPKYRCQVICNNQPDMSPKEIWQDYNKRARCELNIRDLDYDHFITKVPTGNFKSNFAWFWHSVFSYNLMLIFRLFALPEEWEKARSSTLRKKLINIPGRLVNLGGRMTMRLMQGYPYTEVFNYVKERLRWLFWKLNPLPA